MKKSILMIFVFFVLVNWHISALVYGQTRELITGAFGFKLGETLDTQKFKFKSKDWGLSGYRGVSPRIPNKIFDTYWLKVSPISDTIVGIKARGEKGGAFGCDKKIALGLTAALTRKYGNPKQIKRQRVRDIPFQFFWTDISGGQIEQICGMGMYHITYSSKALDKLYKVEREQEVAKSVDDTGL